MDIWLSRCNKTVRCAYCLEDITLGEPTVFGKLWRRQTESGSEVRKWVLNFRWHAKRKRDGQCCWLVVGLEHFSNTPYVEKRGRKRLDMSVEDKQRRLKLLRERARLVMQINEIGDSGSIDDKDVDKFIRIGVRLEELRDSIAVVGGVPKSWS